MYYLNVYIDGNFDEWFKFNCKEEMNDFCLYQYNELPEYEGENVANIYYS